MTEQAASNPAAGTGESARIAALYRYPVKGMSPEPLDTVRLAAGEGLPGDRAFAIENGPGRFDPLAPRHLPKIHFLMLMRDERLATIETHFDHATTTLKIRRDGAEVARGDLSVPIGRKMIEQFLSSYFARELRGAPKIVSAPGHMFSDVAEKCVHIVNLESVRAVERAAGRSLDPLRFRANIYLEGLPAWREFDWIGRAIRLGPLRASVFARTERCAATNVDLRTANRNADVPAFLRRNFGHSDLGIYATISTGGDVARGDPVAPTPEDHA